MDASVLSFLQHAPHLDCTSASLLPYTLSVCTCGTRVALAARLLIQLLGAKYEWTYNKTGCCCQHTQRFPHPKNYCSSQSAVSFCGNTHVAYGIADRSVAMGGGVGGVER